MYSDIGCKRDVDIVQAKLEATLHMTCLVCVAGGKSWIQCLWSIFYIVWKVCENTWFVLESELLLSKSINKVLRIFRVYEV